MKMMRRRSEVLFLLYFNVFLLLIAEISSASHPLAAIYESTGRSHQDSHSIREQRQITFRNSFQDIPKSLQNSVFTNRTNEIFPGPKYYVILSDVQSSSLGNLLGILSKNGRIYFSPNVNVLDRIDDPNFNEISKSTAQFLEQPMGRSIDSQVPNLFPEAKVRKSLLTTNRSLEFDIDDTFDELISGKLVPPTKETPEISKQPMTNIQNRKVKIFTKSLSDNSVKRRASFNDLHSSAQMDGNQVGKMNEVSHRPNKNLSKREENSEVSFHGEVIAHNANISTSRPDFLSFIKHRSKNLSNKNEDRIGEVDNELTSQVKPRPTISKLVDMWKKMNNRYRKRLVTPPSSLIKRKQVKKSLRSSSIPSKTELDFSSSDEPRNIRDIDLTETQHRKSLQIQAMEASRRQEKRLKSITEFPSDTDDVMQQLTLPLTQEDNPVGNERGRENIEYSTGDNFYSDFPEIPQTSFSCSHQPSSGYYADVDTHCQVFHVCWGRRKASFTCPSGTAFSQKLQVCDWRQHVQCNYR